MHAKAQVTIEKKIVGCLQNCQIVDNWPQFDSFKDHINSLSKNILAHKHEWLSISDVYSILYDLVYEAILSHVDKNEKVSGGLWDLLGEEKSLALTQTLKDFYLSVPRQYHVYVPLPNVTADSLETINLSEKCSIHIFSKGDDIPGGFETGLLRFDNKFDVDKLYIKFVTSGYFNTSLDNYSVKKTISKFKILTHQAISTKILKIQENTPAGIGLLGGFTHFQIPKSNLICIDQLEPKNRIINTELSLEVSKLLNGLILNTENDLVSSALERGPINTFILSTLNLPTLLIECTDAEAKRVISSIEWCFDSYTSTDSTLSFLQVCIGLEALLGEDSNSESITKTLADRCSYLIGDNIKDRKTIKENFIKLYGIRSKLIHGVESSLSANQTNFLHWGKDILEYAISKEIRHLKLDKN